MNQDHMVPVLLHLPDEDIETTLPAGAIPSQGEIILWENGSGFENGRTLRVSNRSWTFRHGRLTYVNIALDYVT